MTTEASTLQRLDGMIAERRLVGKHDFVRYGYEFLTEVLRVSESEGLDLLAQKIGVREMATKRRSSKKRVSPHVTQNKSS